MNATPAPADQISDDDWAAAMNEQASAEAKPAAQPAQIFEQLSEGPASGAQPRGFDMIMDIPVSMTVELGRTKISIRNLLQLAHGSVVELDGLAGEQIGRAHV